MIFDPPLALAEFFRLFGVASSTMEYYASRGLRICGQCGWARDPQTGLCIGSSDHGGEPYAPGDSNYRTLTFG